AIIHFRDQLSSFVLEASQFKSFIVNLRQEIGFLYQENHDAPFSLETEAKNRMLRFCYHVLDPYPGKRLLWYKIRFQPTETTSTRQNVFAHLPWLHKNRPFTRKFLHLHRDSFQAFLLLLLQQNKTYKRQDALCLILGSFNLFCQFVRI